MEKQKFLSTVESMVDELYTFVEENLPNNGDKCSESQRMCLLNSISEVSHNVNGLEDEDFIEKEV